MYTEKYTTNKNKIKKTTCSFHIKIFLSYEPYVPCYYLYAMYCTNVPLIQSGLHFVSENGILNMFFFFKIKTNAINFIYIRNRIPWIDLID